GCQRQYSPGWRHGYRDQGPQGQGFIPGGEGGHQGEEYPPGGGRSRYRLQDRRYRRHEAQIGVCEKNLRGAAGWSIFAPGAASAVAPRGGEPCCLPFSHLPPPPPPPRRRRKEQKIFLPITAEKPIKPFSAPLAIAGEPGGAPRRSHPGNPGWLRVSWKTRGWLSATPRAAP